jgi:hypothetical protein
VAPAREEDNVDRSDVFAVDLNERLGDDPVRSMVDMEPEVEAWMEVVEFARSEIRREGSVWCDPIFIPATRKSWSEMPFSAESEGKGSD